MLFLAMAATPESESEMLPLMLGLAITFHRLPFQCSTRVRPPLPLLYVPTAQTFLFERAATPFRKLLLVPAFGLGTLLHTPQVLLCICCGRLVADAAVHPLRKKAASATTTMLGKMMIFRRFIKTLPGCSLLQWKQTV